MTLESFDIRSLLSFRPATRFCQKCYGLNVTVPKVKDNLPKFVCGVCDLEYVGTSGHTTHQQAINYFESQGLIIRFRDVMTHSQSLATIANNLHLFSSTSQHKLALSPMQGLLEALSMAQQFVHFVTYGMSPELFGVMRMLSFRVPVRGIISNAPSNIVREIKEYGSESPKLECKLFERSGNPKKWASMPHQKIIIIDGLLAFKGSANLTLDGWRKAAKGLDALEVVTDVKEVVNLNNRYFSPVWGSFSDLKQVTMYGDADDIPF